MTDRFVRHATFAIERSYPVPPERVYRAMADPEAKSKWFTKPEIFEFRVGGREYSSGAGPDGKVYAFDSRYLEIVPELRIVYCYTMDADDIRISASLTTIELFPADGGTRLVFTEQGVFFDGHDTPEIREQGTKELLDALGRSLQGSESAEPDSEENAVINARKFAFPRETVFAAWSNPELLARWWGPHGFSSTFETFDFRPGGDWRFVMHGPDGTDYPNHNVFQEIVPAERIVIRHLFEPGFRLTAIFEEADGGTKLTWRQRFDSRETFERMKSFVAEMNEQNFDRLNEVLNGMRR